VEVHPDPSTAASGGAHSLTLGAFGRLVAGVARFAEAAGRHVISPPAPGGCRMSAPLEDLRTEIERLDREIVDAIRQWLA
jgi:hypothetical protein